jgi:drug/metabolite transporter (DMT)-like permease
VCAAGVLLLGVNYGLVFWGAQFVPSGLVAILLSGTPVLALAFGWMLGSERASLRKVVALAAGVAGVCIIFGAEARTSGPSAVAGSAAVFGGSACVAFAYVWLKSRARQLPPIAVTAVQSAAGLVPLAGLGLTLEGPPAAASWSPAAWVGLIYLAIFASVLAFWLNYWLLARMDASAMLMMGVAEVPIAIALGAVVFDERLPAGTLAGGTCVLAGVTMGLYRRAR